MNISATNRNGIVTLSIDGRLDTAATAQATSQIEQQLSDCETINTLVCDASKLEYISSSGLRVLLSLAKKYKDFRIIDRLMFTKCLK